MKKQNLSNRTKIIIIIMVVFLALVLLGFFTDILKENPIYEGGFWLSILAWMVSMYFEVVTCKIYILIRHFERTKYILDTFTS